MAQKIERQELKRLFLESLIEGSYEIIDGLNPFNIIISGVEYYIYIKNLSPAYFANPDVWRVQLPIRDEFTAIKETATPFILLGYDADNDVYTSWNPIWTKQRLNVAESVSFYSRLSLQQDVNEKKIFKRLTLNNDGEVIAFPREFLSIFFENIDTKFQGVGDYVAMGSKKRTEANDAYKTLCDISNISSFAKYLSDKSYSQVTINNYSRVIKNLISEGTFTQHRRVFLTFDSLSEYLQAIPEFLAISDIAEKNKKWNNLISAALQAYITFLQEQDNTNAGETPETEDKPFNLFHIITAKENVDTFEDYLCSDRVPKGKVYNRSTVCNYCRGLNDLIEGGYFEKHKNLFDKYSSVKDIPAAFNEFINRPDIYPINIDAHNLYSATLRQYAVHLSYQVENSGTQYHVQDKRPTVLQDPNLTNEDSSVTIPAEDIDWEAKFTDKDGNLTKIANPKLIEQLRPYLDTEYRELVTAFNVIYDFYGERFPGMELSDWKKLMNAINWKSPYAELTKSPARELQESTRKKKYVLRVEFPDGRVIMSKNSTDTFLQVIEKSYPDLIAEIGLLHSGINIVMKHRDPEYGKFQKEISNGWYVFTNLSTERKYEDLIQINEAIGLGLKIELVSIEDNIPADTSCIVSGYRKTQDRNKIRVKFPDGRIIEHSKVLNTLLDVVKFAGPLRVRELNIIVCGDNMITKTPAPRYVQPCKPVGDGWLCNTCSDTNTKYYQIVTISERLNLGLQVELV